MRLLTQSEGRHWIDRYPPMIARRTSSAYLWPVANKLLKRSRGCPEHSDRDERAAWQPETAIGDAIFILGLSVKDQLQNGDGSWTVRCPFVRSRDTIAGALGGSAEIACDVQICRGHGTVGFVRDCWFEH